jgi:hypothetical protein
MDVKNYYGEIEYRMSAEMAREILKARKGEDSKMHPQKYLCQYVNEECGLKGYCTLVTTTL